LLSDLTLPTDWAAVVFGRHDVTPYPHPAGAPPGAVELAGPGFVATIVGARQVDTTPAPTWQTSGDYHSSHLDIVLGKTQPDSPAWLTPAHLRETALQPGAQGVIHGIVPLSWLSSVVLPTDFTADELAAQSSAEDDFSAGRPLQNKTIGTPSHPFWLDVFASPLAAGPAWAPTAILGVRSNPILVSSWQVPPPVVLRNSPISILATLTAAGALTVERASSTILAAARALALREVPIWVVYV
jgi:hypothetical protein